MRYKKPDKKSAESILEAAKREMQYTLHLEVTEDAGPTITRNIYESFRMIGDALLTARGIQSEDHIAPIKELESLQVKTTRPLQVIDTLRRLRHNINYYGYKPNIHEVKDAVAIAKECFGPAVKATQDKIYK